jgi:GGDEF domain-containing protein
VVESIHKAVATPHGNPDSPVSVTASIGIACFPEDAEQAAKLIELAKLAMRAAKVDGGNRTQFFSALSPQPED